MSLMEHRYRPCEIPPNFFAKFAVGVAKFVGISTNSIAKVKSKVAKSSRFDVFEIA